MIEPADLPSSSARWATEASSRVYLPQMYGAMIPDSAAANTSLARVWYSASSAVPDSAREPLAFNRPTSGVQFSPTLGVQFSQRSSTSIYLRTDWRQSTAPLHPRLQLNAFSPEKHILKVSGAKGRRVRLSKSTTEWQVNDTYSSVAV
jgi:hypothetical protein